jgi:hypothetical protein
MNNLNPAHVVAKATMKNNVTFKDAKEVRPGDVVVDRAGNEMVVIEVLDEGTGECFALFNGAIKRINTSRVSMVVPQVRLDE